MAVISHTITIKSDTPQLRWSPFPVCFSSANSDPTLPTDTALLPGVASPTSSTTSPSSLHSLPFQLASPELGENDGDVGPTSIPCPTFITTWGNPWGKAAHLSRLSTRPLYMTTDTRCSSLLATHNVAVGKCDIIDSKMGPT